VSCVDSTHIYSMYHSRGGHRGGDGRVTGSRCYYIYLSNNSHVMFQLLALRNYFFRSSGQLWFNGVHLCHWFVHFLAPLELLPELYAEHMEEDEQTSKAIPPWVELEYAVGLKGLLRIGSFSEPFLSTCAPSRGQTLKFASRISPDHLANRFQPSLDNFQMYR